MNESGHYSIAGFFFQLLASADDALKLYLVEDDQNNPMAMFEIERLGQDAVAYPNKGRCRLIQYKYSSVGAELGPTDLRDILIAFKKSLDAGKLEANDVDLYLTTNRKLNSACEAWRNSTNPKEFKSHLHDGVSEEGIAKLPYTLLWPVFQRLVRRQLGPDDAISSIASLSRQYGMLKHEIEPGVQNVIALMVKTASLPGARSINRQKLIEALVQHPSPYRLNHKDSIDLQKQEVLSFRNAETQFTKTISRSISAQISSMTKSQPLVIVKGEGGVGKSVAMSDAAIINLGNPTLAPTFALILKAANLERSSVQSAVARWRNQPNNPDGNDLHQCLERLRGVSSFVPTVAVYVDGIDERGGLQSLSPDARGSLISLIQVANDSFRTQRSHNLSVVLSCRTEAELQGLGGGGFAPASLPTPICVGEFDDDEVKALASDLHGDVNVTGRIKAHFAVRNMRPNSNPSSLPPVDPQRARLLSRPILWRFFSELCDVDRHAFLDGAPHALEVLARKYVSWFFCKVADRIGQLNRDMAMEAFQSVAARFIEGKNLTPATYKGDWTQPLREIGCAVIYHRQLFEEGVSAGVFVKEDTENQIWQWKHDWLRDSFAKGDNWNDR